MTKFKIPFIYQLHDTFNNPYPIPNKAEFELELDEEIGLLKQKYSPKIDKLLEKSYKLGSVLVGNTLKDKIGKEYTQGILNYIEKIQGHKEYKNKKILEIGCGEGHLLNEIKLKGGEVMGIEPGEEQINKHNTYNIPIIKGFYPHVTLKEKFDIIISYCVLEHIVNPIKFLEPLKKILTPGGRVYIIVPNNLPYIKEGDISPFFHEHWSYFTHISLNNLYKKINTNHTSIEESPVGGLLYSSFSFKNSTTKNDSLNVDNSYYSNFFKLIEENVKNIKSHLATKEIVGIYAPIRIVNYIVNYNIDIKNIRFFDDSTLNHHKYFPDINIRIENFNEFISNPPNKVIIMSKFFGETIKTKIKKNIKRPINIILWEEIFRNNE